MEIFDPQGRARPDDKIQALPFSVREIKIPVIALDDESVHGQPVHAFQQGWMVLPQEVLHLLRSLHQFFRLDERMIDGGASPLVIVAVVQIQRVAVHRQVAPERPVFFRKGDPADIIDRFHVDAGVAVRRIAFRLQQFPAFGLQSVQELFGPDAFCKRSGSKDRAQHDRKQESNRFQVTHSVPPLKEFGMKHTCLYNGSSP